MWALILSRADYRPWVRDKTERCHRPSGYKSLISSSAQFSEQEGKETVSTGNFSGLDGCKARAPRGDGSLSGNWLSMVKREWQQTEHFRHRTSGTEQFKSYLKSINPVESTLTTTCFCSLFPQSFWGWHVACLVHWHIYSMKVRDT